MNVLARARAWLRARLIADIRIAWRFASVQIAVAGVALELLLETGLIEQFVAPVWTGRVQLAVLAAVLISRLVAQKSVRSDD